ncbi:Fe-S cluster assembly iron-binding protein IscA [Oikeobacillus pervagus]|uniref:Fe-S cluster assembly iron-binding protein IscA n=1 Tax=Oikeobacillus pervagus TaxID=1325931 RepID=A0AAJ1WFJ5_9BACI|nr:adhesin [Oikeobacillus pervagus]MDQ0214022.1 Fe-S cluster assembly iron-binding protein IscA [Oikeobacillus pervagus]
MRITDEAKQLLQNVFDTKGVEGIRLTTTAGCCGPQIALTIDAPQEFDRVQTINGIKVAFDPAVTGTEELTLDREENQNGVGLVLIGGSNCC